VLEVVDLVNAPVTNGKKVKVSRSTVFAVLKVLEENGNVLAQYNSETRSFCSGESLFLGEEFLFENVSSAHMLQVAFFAVTLEKSKAQPIATPLQTCLGYVQIPLSRLEDNAPVCGIVVKATPCCW
jgi:hypothetical protein